MTERWFVELFGGLRVRRGDCEITRFRTHKTGALLAYLAFYCERPHPRDLLVELLWPESTPEAARQSLRVALTFLRHPLEPPGVPQGSVVLADRNTIRANPQAITTDVAAFETALQRAAATDHLNKRIDLLAQAVELYRGELLSGYFEAWVLPQMLRLDERYYQAIREQIALLEQTERQERAIELANRAVTIQPLQEDIHADLMRLYAATGRPLLGLRQFQELERLLQQTGESPSEITRRLAAQLASFERVEPARSLAPSSASLKESRPERVPQPPTLSPQAPLLPPTLTRFFGREEELARLAAIIGARCSMFGVGPLPNTEYRTPSTRLVTLTGVGGTGKTRLALVAAERLTEAYPGAVWFVPLVDLTDFRLLPDAIAAALRLPRSPNTEPLEQIVAFLNTRPGQGAGNREQGTEERLPLNSRLTTHDSRLSPERPSPSLFVLDNFEQLVDEGATVVSTLLQRVPTLTCLMTSRKCLELEGEQEFPVLPLPVPTQPDTPERLMEFASVQLFVDRAQLARSDFQITRLNARAVAELCHRLEGLPLALELAAAQISVMSAAQMLAQLGNRFEFLVSRKRDKPDRHRSLRATIGWSYALLSPELQRLFCKLSVFRGGWTAEAAEAVAGRGAAGGGRRIPVLPDPRPPSPDTLDLLAQLRASSLILVGERGQEVRFRMLETLREFAAEQLLPHERAALGRRHTDYYLAMAERAEPELRGPEQTEWLSRLEAENDNLRAAMEYGLSAEGNGEDSLRLAGTLARFWEVYNRCAEGRVWLDRALARNGEVEGKLRAKALRGAGNLAWHQGDYTAARSFHEQCLVLQQTSGDRRNVARTLGSLGLVAWQQGDFTGATALFEECLTACREVGDRQAIATTLNNLGILARQQQRPEEARTYLEEGLHVYRERGDIGGMANCLINLGNVLLDLRDLDTGRRYYEESLTLYREVGNRRGVAFALHNLGQADCEAKDFASARTSFAESLTLHVELGNKYGLIDALEGRAHLEAVQGHSERAAGLFGAAEDLREAIGVPMPAVTEAKCQPVKEALRRSLSEEGYAAAFNEGRMRGWERAIEEELAE